MNSGVQENTTADSGIIDKEATIVKILDSVRAKNDRISNLTRFYLLSCVFVTVVKTPSEAHHELSVRHGKRLINDLLQLDILNE